MGAPGGEYLYCETNHLTDFGIVSIPTSFSELLAELANIPFNFVTLDDIASMLTDFDIGENLLIFLVVVVFGTMDMFTISLLGLYRGRRRRLARKRLNRAYESEEKAYELAALQRELMKHVTKRALTKEIREELKCVAVQANMIRHRTEQSVFNGSVPNRLWSVPSRLTTHYTLPIRRVHPEAAAALAPEAREGIRQVPIAPSLCSGQQTRDASGGTSRWGECETKPMGAGGGGAKGTHSDLESVFAHKRERAIAKKQTMSRAATEKARRKVQRHLRLEIIREEREKGRQHRLMAHSLLQRTIMYQVCIRVRRLIRQLCDVCREEHTIVSMIAPPDDPEALTTAQTIQIFWNVLILELVLICINFRPPDGSSDERRGGGRRSRNSAANGDPNKVAINFSFSTIPLVPTIVTGLIAAGITAAIVMVCTATFRWGNSRIRRRRIPVRLILREACCGWRSSLTWCWERLPWHTTGLHVTTMAESYIAPEAHKKKVGGVADDSDGTAGVDDGKVDGIAHFHMHAALWAMDRARRSAAVGAAVNATEEVVADHERARTAMRACRRSSRASARWDEIFAVTRDGFLAEACSPQAAASPSQRESWQESSNSRPTRSGWAACRGQRPGSCSKVIKNAIAVELDKSARAMACVRKSQGVRASSDDRPTNLSQPAVAAVGLAAVSGEGGTPPQEGDTPPQEGGTPPQEGGTPPQEGGTPPQEGGTPPQEGGTPPQEGGTPPQEGEPLRAGTAAAQNDPASEGQRSLSFLRSVLRDPPPEGSLHSKAAVAPPSPPASPPAPETDLKAAVAPPSPPAAAEALTGEVEEEEEAPPSPLASLPQSLSPTSRSWVAATSLASTQSMADDLPSEPIPSSEVAERDADWKVRELFAAAPPSVDANGLGQETFEEGKWKGAASKLATFKQTPPQPLSGDVEEEVEEEKTNFEMSGTTPAGRAVFFRSLSKRLRPSGNAATEDEARRTRKLKRFLGRRNAKGLRVDTLSTAAMVASYIDKTDRYQWRGACEYWTRQLLGWGFNLLINFVCCILSLTFGAVKLKAAATSFMLIAWLVAACQTYLVIEPLQICVITLLPCFFRDDTRCGRCNLRIRYIYNEIFSP